MAQTGPRWPRLREKKVREDSECIIVHSNVDARSGEESVTTHAPRSGPHASRSGPRAPRSGPHASRSGPYASRSAPGAVVAHRGRGSAGVTWVGVEDRSHGQLGPLSRSQYRTWHCTPVAASSQSVLDVLSTGLRLGDSGEVTWARLGWF
eukprot:1499666-Rhodomonas_salina.1